MLWRRPCTYDTFISSNESKYAGSSQYVKEDLFAMVGLEEGNPFKQHVTKYLYSTSSTKVPGPLISKTLEELSKESNWMGYVAMATDEGKANLQRRDIVIAWRGTIQPLEWANNLQFLLVSASKILGEEHEPKVRRLAEEYKDEEISITVVGHSLGGVMATLNAVDIAANELNNPRNRQNKACPVTAFVFGSPRIGDSSFKEVFSGLKNVRVLRVRNTLDVVPVRIKHTHKFGVQTITHNKDTNIYVVQPTGEREKACCPEWALAGFWESSSMEYSSLEMSGNGVFPAMETVAMEFLASEHPRWAVHKDQKEDSSWKFNTILHLLTNNQML
ncbi:phospholipase A1-IIgamma-like [Camellia sinensis]|uniref:phospholipase A1-IIgamma-like n=1 Tax=Camellia sinensis TaxID=4442 RepID=UPI0010364EAA|nr:phospholipase A1-IIgamma-like [Camellia sinensis]